MFSKQNQVSDIIKTKLMETNGKGFMPTLRGAPIKFWVSSTNFGIETEKLPNFILEWEHFDEIVRKANQLSGLMYRGDALAQGSGRLGEEIPHDCMEGFIAKDLLYIEDGVCITRRSTYYSGILAWAGIVTIHRSQGKGSFITVNPKYRKI